MRTKSPQYIKINSQMKKPHLKMIPIKRQYCRLFCLDPDYHYVINFYPLLCLNKNEEPFSWGKYYFLRYKENVVIVFNWIIFEMRLLNLRINCYLLRTFCPHLGRFLLCFFFFHYYISAKFHLLVKEETTQKKTYQDEDKKSAINKN